MPKKTPVRKIRKGVNEATLKKTPPRRSSSAPILYASRPAAGFPAPGDDLVESRLDLNQLLIEHPTSTFFVRVEGDSMIGIGVHGGDILVVDRSLEAHSGSIVVAAVYGELVVKRLKRTGKTLSLISENPSYTPIVLTGDDDCHLWGVVTGLVRSIRS